MANSGITSATRWSSDTDTLAEQEPERADHQRLGAGEDDVAAVGGGRTERLVGDQLVAGGHRDLARRQQPLVDLASAPIEQIGQLGGSVHGSGTVAAVREGRGGTVARRDRDPSPAGTFAGAAARTGAAAGRAPLAPARRRGRLRAGRPTRASSRAAARSCSRGTRATTSCSPPPDRRRPRPTTSSCWLRSRATERVDSRLLISGLAVVVTVVAGLAGALVGLFDDRSRYRASPRFEVYLRERPAEAPSDPWDRPVIPEHDLGERLPDIEWREVRVVVWVGILAVVALAWLGPWSDVRHAIDHLRWGWVAAAVVLVALTYPLAAGGVVAATDGPDGRRRRPFPPVLATAVAASFTGRLLSGVRTGGPGRAPARAGRTGPARRARLHDRARHGVAVGAHRCARARRRRRIRGDALQRRCPPLGVGRVAGRPGRRRRGTGRRPPPLRHVGGASRPALAGAARSLDRRSGPAGRHGRVGPRPGARQRARGAGGDEGFRRDGPGRARAAGRAAVAR